MILREKLTFHQSFKQAQPLYEHVEEGSKKTLYMTGIFLQGDVKNQNERIYPVHEIRKAVNQVSEMIRSDDGTCLGELDHPTELNINSDRISHMITQMWMDGPNGMGKLKVFSTPMGQIVRTLIEEGAKLGVSSRGSGNVDERGYVSDFEIVTVDIVARPSAPNAYPKPVFEALNTRNGKLIESLAEAVRHDPKAQTELGKLLLEAISKLSA